MFQLPWRTIVTISRLQVKSDDMVYTILFQAFKHLKTKVIITALLTFLDTAAESSTLRKFILFAEHILHIYAWACLPAQNANAHTLLCA